MNKETMRKHYERTPKETLINILISSREQVDKLQKRNEERKQENERLNKGYCKFKEQCGKYATCLRENQIKEIERLNNMINEIEKYINENYIYDEVGMKIFDASTLQDKLQELKGSDKE